MNETTDKYAVLVYQGAFANVFEVDCLNACDFGRNAKRILQHDFRTCETFCLGLGHAGWKVASAWCNQAGEIANSKWNFHDIADAPFSDKMFPVFRGVVNPDELTVEVAGEVRYVF